MKKLFTLLMLMVCSIGAAWAVDETEKSPTTGTQDGTVVGKSYTIDGKYVAGGCEKFGTMPEKGVKLRTTKDDHTLVFAVNEGYIIKNIQFDGYSNNGDKATTIDKITVDDGEASIINESVVLPAAENKTGKKNSKSFTISGFSAKEKITLHFTSDSHTQIGLYYKITYEFTKPVLSSSEKALTLSLSPYTTQASTTFKLTGQNLTNGTYDITVPSVAGLSVTPQSFTVSEGVANQEFIVSYTSEVDVEKTTANIVASTSTADDVSVTIPVTYFANITGYKQTVVAEAKTWDWTSLVGDDVQLTADSKPSKNDAIVLKNLEDRISFPATFDAQALVVKAEYPLRKNKFQNGEIMFKTSTAGYITVDFSDTGTKGTDPTNRYLNVNGVNTEYYVVRTGTSDGRKTTGEIFVPAGEVVIKGRNSDNTADAAFCLYKLTFTPMTSQSITISDAKYATCVTKTNLDFTGTDVTAYTVSEVGETTITLAKAEKVAAGQAVIVGAAAGGTYEIPTTTETVSAVINQMTYSDNDTEVAEGELYYIVANGDNGVGFYPVKANTTIAAGKGFIKVEANHDKKFLAFGFGGETTGIDEVKTAADKTVEIYNLNGQRVAAPSKGLYIMNGKKVIIK